jgi:predicted aspartyl protease
MARSWLKFNPRRVPVVSVRIGPGRYYALVDTGAEICMVSPSLSLRLGLKQIGFKAIVGLTGKRETLRVVELPGVGFANLELEPCGAGVLSVSGLGLPIDLILGVNAFKGRRIRFDFGEGRIYMIQ